MHYRLIILIMVIGLAACGASQQAPPTTQPTNPPSTLVPTATPQTITEPTQPSPTPLTLPTAAPSVIPWPLSADLYYLNDAGQVWRQLQLGDENAVSTITRLDINVTDYSIAPGAEWIAYRSDGNIFISSIDGQQGQLIAQNVGEAPRTGRTLTWSPDGRRLAYVSPQGFQVYSPSEGVNFTPIIFDAQEPSIADLLWSPNGNWLVATRGDGSAALYTINPTLTLWADLGTLNGYIWLPDGRLVFAPSTGGLALLPPEDLAARSFLVPEGRIVSKPATTPEGSLVFFIHPAGVEQPGFLHMGNPFDQSFGAVTSFGMLTQGWLWDPTGTRLYRPTPDGTIESINPIDGAPAAFSAAGEPTRLQFAEPPLPEAETPDIPNAIYFRALQAGVTQVWRLRGDGTAAQPITAAEQDITEFAISEQGTQIAYVSGGQLYRQLIDAADAEPLRSLSTEGLANPDWSPDGTRIAYNDNGIWIYNVNTDDDRRLLRDRDAVFTGSERTIELYRQPQWSPDGQWLLLRIDFFEGFDLAITPVTEFGVRSEPIPLNQFGAAGEWVETNQAVTYGQGGRISDPSVTVITPSPEPTTTTLLELPTADITLQEEGRILLLRVASPFAVGPSTVSAYSVLGEGSDLQQETNSYVIAEPQLSPNGGYIVGLRNIRIDAEGVRTANIEIINLQTGERLTVGNIPRVFDVIWGP